MNAHNKKFLKDTFNIDVDKYPKDTLDEILKIINKKVLIRTKETLEYNKVISNAVKYYETFLRNE